jgi:hypothetical protein
MRIERHNGFAYGQVCRLELGALRSAARCNSMLPTALVQCAECQKPVATTAAACRGIVIRVYDEAANVIERRTHAGYFKEPRSIPITALPPREGVWLRFPCEILQPNLGLAIADRLSSPTQPITMSAGRRVISIFIVSVSRTYLFSYV